MVQILAILPILASMAFLSVLTLIGYQFCSPDYKLTLLAVLEV